MKVYYTCDLLSLSNPPKSTKCSLDSVSSALALLCDLVY